MILESISTLYKFNGSYTVMLFLFILLFVKIIRRNRSLSGKKVIPLFSLMAISGISYLCRSYGMTDYLAFFVMLLCFVWMSELKSIDMEAVFEKIAWLYVISVLIECVFSTLMPTAVRAVTDVSEYVYRSTGFSSSWNYGRHIVVAISFLIYWILVKREKIVVAGALILFLLYSMISTGLYSGLVAIAILMVIIPFSFEGSIRKRVSYGIIALVVCIIGLIATYYWVYLPMRDLRGAITDNGRFNLWKAYANDFMTQPSIALFGVGAGAIQNYAASVFRQTAHSILIEKMFELGIIGSALLVVLLRRCFLQHGLQVSRNHRVLPFFAFIGTCLTQGVTGNELIFILMILCL